MADKSLQKTLPCCLPLDLILEGRLQQELQAMIITVKILRGRECTIEAPVTSSVSFVKQLVARELDIPVDQQRLVFRGKTLSDSHSLGDYDIVDGTKLHLVVRKSDLAQDEDGHLLQCRSKRLEFYAELEKTLIKHFTKDAAAKVLEQFKKELDSTLQDMSLDDIERFALSYMQQQQHHHHSSMVQATSSSHP